MKIAINIVFVHIFRGKLKIYLAGQYMDYCSLNIEMTGLAETNFSEDLLRNVSNHYLQKEPIYYIHNSGLMLLWTDLRFFGDNKTFCIDVSYRIQNTCLKMWNQFVQKTS